ncbi:uncharacterized protein si:dkey-79d12.4 [Pangasianodon hypophthalmus]|uniref:uncharacterized protein si:dkey-79d12.4 n=1 Tax=Pangasianodon hypophthalmus TaxID=310915 RepID=UPI000F01050D|nr:uncharacterized protein si:dkey-79d12.4 [Pangasianodon hypophthalmus]XP_026769370.3 uncharacterized protein si:dkey-79d12.4 [Pangasianodon hypophthalmus]
MEIACKERARAVGAERQRDENTVNEQNECTVTWSVPNLEASSEEEVVSGGFSDDLCCECGRNVAFLDHQTEHFIKHTDEVCCHLCQMKFSHMNALALHLKNAHPKYHIFCKSCNMYMGRHPLKQWTVVTDKTPETPKQKLLDEEVEEVIIENEEVEIKYVKEEEEEVVVGRMEETEENSTTETPEDNKMVNRNLHDHTYFSTQTYSSIRETTNNVVMYTSSENVLVFINKTDTSISPKDLCTESDQQGTPVDDQTVCRGIHDHTYFSIQSLANHMPLEKQVSAHNTCSFFCKTANNVINSSTENIHVFNNKADTRISPKDPESTESDQDQIRKHELVCSGLLDHTYFSRQSLANHTVLSKRVPSPNTCRSSTHKANKEKLLKIQTHRNNVTMTDEETTQRSSAAVLEASQLEYNIKVEDDLCEFEPIQEDVVIGEYEESIQRSDHEHSNSLPIDDLIYTSQDDLNSDTMSCTSTDNNGDTSEESCKSKSWSSCQKQNCENTNQKSLGSVDYVNSNPATSLYKDLQICTCCGLSKVLNTEKSMERCTCTQFTCSLCGIMFGTEEMLLNHQAEKHPLAKYMCVSCLQLFPNQNIFIQHVCSKSRGFSGKSLTPSNSSNNAKEPLLMILNFVPSPAAVESSKQSPRSQSVNILNTAQNLGTVSNSTSHSLPNSPTTSASQKVPIQVMATRSSSCAQKKKVTCLVLNGDQGQETTRISTVTQKQIGQVQVLSPLQAKVLSQTPSSSSSSSSTTTTTTQILLSSQGQGQMTPISTVTQTKSGQMQDLTPLQTKLVTHTPTGSADLMTSIVLPQQDPSFEVHLPHPFLSQVSSSMSIPSQTGQLPESSVPFLDVCRSSPSSQILPSSQGPLKIVAMFVNQSKELALQKRMRQSWRSKAVFPCRQCGAVSRQFSLGVRHRYQHRGPRLHRCQCGRAFQQRMHLLRHQVQHAEATRYVCAACGQMFCGTQQLACHRPLFRITPSNRKKQANKECRNMFQCYCGHSFTRPAALLWHMLKNSKARKPRLKGFRLT